MAATNTTPNYNLPQFTDDDVPTWLGDWNDSMSKIDTAVHGKQDTLVFEGEGQNIKTINGQSLSGVGDIAIGGGVGVGLIENLWNVKRISGHDKLTVSSNISKVINLGKVIIIMSNIDFDYPLSSGTGFSLSFALNQSLLPSEFNNPNILFHVNMTMEDTNSVSHSYNSFGTSEQVSTGVGTYNMATTSGTYIGNAGLFAILTPSAS